MTVAVAPSLRLSRSFFDFQDFLGVVHHSISSFSNSWVSDVVHLHFSVFDRQAFGLSSVDGGKMVVYRCDVRILPFSFLIPSSSFGVPFSSCFSFRCRVGILVFCIFRHLVGALISQSDALLSFRAAGFRCALRPMAVALRGRTGRPPLVHLRVVILFIVFAFLFVACLPTCEFNFPRKFYAY